MGNSRLQSNSFHETFVPETSYLFQILKLAKTSQLYNLTNEEISKQTLIPTGKVSGKVLPHILFAEGMGLIANDNGLSKLTPLGLSVYDNDSLLDEKITQWILHVNLCDFEEGALLWSKVFTTWPYNTAIRRQEICDKFEIAQNSLAPVFNMYFQDRSFSLANIIEKDDDSYKKRPLNVNNETIYGIGYIFIHLLNQYFPNTEQVNLESFCKTTQLYAKLNWSEADLNSVLKQLISLGYIKILSQVKPIVIQPLLSEENAAMQIYNFLF